jgi:hypothetical protein
MVNKNIDGTNFPKYHDKTFGDPPPMNTTFTPQNQIGVDCMRQLITVTEKLLSAIRKVHDNQFACAWCSHRHKRDSPGNECDSCRLISRDLEEDAIMAIREAREWTGDTNESCEGGECHL